MYLFTLPNWPPPEQAGSTNTALRKHPTLRHLGGPCRRTHHPQDPLLCHPSKALRGCLSKGPEISPPQALLKMIVPFLMFKEKDIFSIGTFLHSETAVFFTRLYDLSEQRPCTFSPYPQDLSWCVAYV